MNPFAKKVVGLFVKKLPGILAALALSGWASATYFAVKATPAANLAIENAIIDKGEDLTIVEKGKIYAKHYWRAGILAFLATAALFGSVYAGERKRAILEATLKLSSAALTAQTNAIVEKFGPEALDTIRETVAKNRIETKHNVKLIEQKDIYDDGSAPTGQTIYYDSWFGYQMDTTAPYITEGVAEANRLLRRNDELTANEFFDCIKCKTFDGDALPRHVGDMYGWSNIAGPVELKYEPTGKPIIMGGVTYIMMKFNVDPTHKFGR